MKARIDKIIFVIKGQLLVKLKNLLFYALQCDESTDGFTMFSVTGFCLFLWRTIQQKNFLLLQELDITFERTNIIKIISNYFEKHTLCGKNAQVLC